MLECKNCIGDAAGGEHGDQCCTLHCSGASCHVRHESSLGTCSGLLAKRIPREWQGRVWQEPSRGHSTWAPGPGSVWRYESLGGP